MDILNMVAEMSDSKLDLVIQLLKIEQTARRDAKARTRRVGDSVKFLAGPRRGMRFGVITKINLKKTKVDCNNGEHWNVAHGALESA